MKTRIAAALCGVVLAVFAAAAQSPLSGRWDGQTTNGTPVVLTLKASDTEFTGTLVRGGDNGETMQIAEGKVTKNTFTFKVTLNGETETLTGEFKGDDMKVWLDRQGPERAATLKRVKE